MLPLEAEEWRFLEHAYGPAGDVPQLLEQLARDPRPKADFNAGPWFTLWSSLCHQGDAYTASYAAVPHVVRICRDTEGPVDFSFFQLPACIEVARATGHGPVVPSQLSAAYRDALKELHQCAFEHAPDDWSEEMALSVAAALAAANGQTRVAAAIVNLDDEMLERIITGDI